MIILQLMEENRRKILVTGAGGMLGGYLLPLLEADCGAEVVRYGREEFGADAPIGEVDTVFHLAGSEEESDADINESLTRELISRLDAAPSRAFIYVSSWQVYSADAGEGVDESRGTWGSTEAGKSKLAAERLLGAWAERRGVALAIARPARMFGNGVHGDTLRLFNRVIRGHYVHVRGNDAKTSAVTALDCARALTAIAGERGIFNISDGRAHKWISLVEAMTANAGVPRRMWHLPEKWCHAIAGLFPYLPIVKETLSEKALQPFSQTLVLDNTRISRLLPAGFYDTAEVIARRDPKYPYNNVEF